MSILALLLAGCGSDSAPEPAIDHAFVGPHELDLLKELSPEAPVVETVEHGEPVEVIQRRRRFAKVRTRSGNEGWVDGNMLLSASGMARLRRLSMGAARLPSEGKATVFEALNIHTEPYRRAPSFYQMQEGILVEVVAHRVVPRRSYEPPVTDELVFQPLNSYEPPDSNPAADGPVDDWSLVRLRDGRAGWALTRMLVMAIPDEVAQYAEGHRITSYASLGPIDDDGQYKHHWLWTTLSRLGEPYQFDSFRVFVWSLRRHRYETAYIERNLVGYYPVTVELPKADAGPGEMPVFTLTLREPNGQFVRRTYAFSGYRVRLTGQQPWEPPLDRPREGDSEYVELPPAREPSQFELLVNRVTEFFAGSEEH